MEINIFEVWKQIDGYPNYVVSNLGNVKNTNKDKQLKPKTHRDGYMCVTLYSNGVRKMFQIHRLVSIAFLPNIENHPIVNHKNGIKDDNRVENLEWCTVSQNTKHAFDVLGVKGQCGNTNKPIHRINTTTGEIEKTYNSITEASADLNISRGSILNRIRDRAINSDLIGGGYLWEYSQ